MKVNCGRGRWGSDCGVGESVAEVDAESDEGGAPVVGVAPALLGSCDREVEELAGGVLRTKKIAIVKTCD